MKYIITTLLILFSLSVHGQSWKIESLSIGWRSFERDNIGSNPYTIVSQLKEPLSYLNNLNSLPQNSLTGAPFVMWVDNYYLGAELLKTKQSTFWKRHRIPIGIFSSGLFQYPTGDVSFITWDSIPRRYEERYSLFRQIRILGIHTGLLRKFRLRENLFFVTGLQGQVGVAIQHYYRQIYDTAIFRPGIGWQGNSREAEHLPGKNYVQWQLNIPLALEYHAFRQRIGIRAEVGMGITKNPFTGKNILNGETAHAGFSLFYRFL
jgi:hypothetical protein